MKKMESVPVTRLPTPCARRPNSLAAERLHVCLVVGSEMSCQYSMDSPVSGCMTALRLCMKGALDLALFMRSSVKEGCCLGSGVGWYRAWEDTGCFGCLDLVGYLWGGSAVGASVGGATGDCGALTGKRVGSAGRTRGRGAPLGAWLGGGQRGVAMGLLLGTLVDGALVGECSATLGDGASCGGGLLIFGAGAVAGVLLGLVAVAESNMVTSLSNTCWSAVQSGDRGLDGVGLSRAAVSASAARRAASEEDRCGIGKRCGKKGTVYVTLSPRVSVIQALKHL